MPRTPRKADAARPVVSAIPDPRADETDQDAAAELPPATPAQELATHEALAQRAAAASPLNLGPMLTRDVGADDWHELDGLVDVPPTLIVPGDPRRLSLVLFNTGAATIYLRRRPNSAPGGTWLPVGGSVVMVHRGPVYGSTGNGGAKGSFAGWVELYTGATPIGAVAAASPSISG